MSKDIKKIKVIYNIMTQIQPRKYSLREINEISFDRFVCHIQSDTLLIINDLSTKVGSPTYVKTPIFNKRNGITNNTITSKPSINRQKILTNTKKLQPIEVLNDNDWDTIRSFEVTHLDQKIGFDAIIVSIRSLLNMMTEKNYIEKKTAIEEILKNIYLCENTDNICIIHEIICDIASDNRFYSELYANLYTELCINNKQLISILKKRMHTYIQHFVYNIHITVDVADYDQLCKLNKENDRFKAFGSFIMNLVKTDIVSVLNINEILDSLFTELINIIQEKGHTAIVDEIVENIAILYDKKISGNQRNSSELFGDLTYNSLIQELAALKVKQHPSITNKSIFKFMDILELSVE